MAINFGKKQGAKNIAMNIAAFVVLFVINFYVTPIIVEKCGASAYGFIGLANDFVSYASILASVFNSVAARFIANAFYKNDIKEANRYFNSLIVANLVLSGVLGAVSIALIPNLNYLLTIPEEILFDVKLTFALIFGSYIISLVTTVFTTSTFITNRTDIQGVRNVINSLIRFGIIIIFLNFISIKIYWVALATLVAAVVVAIWNFSLTKKLTPELKINLRDAKKSHTLTLAKSGCWMAFTSLSVVLLRGLDLIVANVFIGHEEMGILSVARTMPNNVTNIISTLAPLFTPAFIALFAKNEISALVKNIKQSVDVMAILLFVPITGFIVFSYDFYGLWQKSLSEEELLLVTLLSNLTVIQAYFNATTSTMAQVSVVVNKLKLPVFISFGCGIVSFVTEILLIKFTPLGLYAIVLSPTVVMILRYVFFNLIYTATCLQVPKRTFVWSTVKTWLSIPVLGGVMWLIRWLLPVSSWWSLILDAMICVVIGYSLMIVVYKRDIIKKVIFKLRKHK